MQHIIIIEFESTILGTLLLKLRTAGEIVLLNVFRFRKKYVLMNNISNGLQSGKISSVEKLICQCYRP